MKAVMLSFCSSLLGFLVDGVKEPLGELPELRRCRLALLLQPHVVLSQVLHLLLEHRFILFLLKAGTHIARTQSTRGT